MTAKSGKKVFNRKGRPASVNTTRPQILSINGCPSMLKLQLITEAEEMALNLSMYVCMVLQGAGREVRKAAAMECAIELEKQNDPTLDFHVTPQQISAFEAALLANPNKEKEEDELMRKRMEQEKAETEELLSKLAEFDF